MRFYLRGNRENTGGKEETNNVRTECNVMCVDGQGAREDTDRGVHTAVRLTITILLSTLLHWHTPFIAHALSLILSRYPPLSLSANWPAERDQVASSPSHTHTHTHTPLNPFLVLARTLLWVPSLHKPQPLTLPSPFCLCTGCWRSLGCLPPITARPCSCQPPPSPNSVRLLAC